MRARSAGDALRALRRGAATSQSVLADRSGVSERTIRGLETGRITSPHTGTLLALASALDLPRERADWFLRIWDGIPALRTYGEAMALDERSRMHDAMREGLMRSFLDRRVVAAHRVITVGANRLIRHEMYQTVVEALSDGVDDHLVVARSASRREDMRLVRIEDEIGCTTRRQDVDVRTNLLAVELYLGESLRNGETKTIGWREINGWVSDGADREQAEDTKYTNAFLRPIASVSLLIVFEGRPPKHLWQVGGIQGLQRVRELTVDEFGTASAAWENAAPGRFGLAWVWD